jgi:hypothetical protein
VLTIAFGKPNQSAQFVACMFLFGLSRSNCKYIDSKSDWFVHKWNYSHVEANNTRPIIHSLPVSTLCRSKGNGRVSSSRESMQFQVLITRRRCLVSHTQGMSLAAWSTERRNGRHGNERFQSLKGASFGTVWVRAILIHVATASSWWGRWQKATRQEGELHDGLRCHANEIRTTYC